LFTTLQPAHQSLASLWRLVVNQNLVVALAVVMTTHESVLDSMHALICQLSLKSRFNPDLHLGLNMGAVSMNMLDSRDLSLAKESTLDQIHTLDKFLASIERRAYQIARMALRDDDEAMDIVQDAMLKLARSYATRPSEEWRPLFYRILNNRIHDWRRRRVVRNKLFGWLPSFNDDGEAVDPYEQVADTRQSPTEQVMQSDAMLLLQQALLALPQRQREAFSLRNFEGMDVAETATAMGCSEGSVKTHYSRAVHSLRETLGEVW
jgi:RNA polymerase sigma-70 factor (ECF subfamily)